MAGLPSMSRSRTGADTRASVALPMLLAALTHDAFVAVRSGVRVPGVARIHHPLLDAVADQQHVDRVGGDQAAA